MWGPQAGRSVAKDGSDCGWLVLLMNAVNGGCNLSVMYIVLIVLSRGCWDWAVAARGDEPTLNVSRQRVVTNDQWTGFQEFWRTAAGRRRYDSVLFSLIIIIIIIITFQFRAIPRLFRCSGRFGIKHLKIQMPSHSFWLFLILTFWDFKTCVIYYLRFF